MPRFETTAPENPTRDFTITGLSKPDEDGKRTTVEATFLARTDVSFGLLVEEVQSAEVGDASLYAGFEVALVAENTAPDGPDDNRSEYERFYDFTASPDVFVSRDALIAALRWIVSEGADRPTPPPSDSRSTRRSGGRGSGGKRSKRG